MSLETGNYIADLVITNPTITDPKSQGDDHFRLIKTVLKETLNGFTGAILVTAADTGTAAAHVLTPTTALVGYTSMLCLLYMPNVTNTGAITVNVSGLGAKSIKTLANADPTAGDIVAGQPLLLMYNGTNFIAMAGSELLSKTGNQTLTGNLTIAGNQTISGTLGVTGATTLNTATGLTLPSGNNTTNLATTAFVTVAVADEATIRLGQDNLKAPLASPTFTGTVTIPSGASIADFAPLASPTFTGTPSAPTAALGTSNTNVATTEFVANTAFNSVLPAQAGNSGKYVTTDGSTASWANVVTGAQDYILQFNGIDSPPTMGTSGFGII
jgi:hypothetical protein